ncbi:MAG: hypothetical protein AMXMBFR47_22060 [Planctomycetota bacterium]
MRFLASTRYWAVAAAGLLLAAAAQAQLGGRSTIIKDATILVGDGTVIESGSLVMQGDKISAVGAEVRGRGRAIDAKGKFITPGLIDVWSTVAFDGSLNGRSGTARAADAFDPFAKRDIEFSLQQGVTTVYLPARTMNGVGGRGSIVRLLPEAAADDYILRSDAALSLGLAMDPRSGALDRVRAYMNLRQLFTDAKAYRKSLEDYEEDLKEYEEKIKKRAEEEAKKPSGDKPAESAPATPGASPSGEQRGPRPGGRPGGRPAPRPSAEEIAAGDSADDGAEPSDDPAQVPPRPRPGRGRRGQDAEQPPPESGRPAAPSGPEFKDDIKKPVAPQKDLTKEALLDAIDGKLLVRVEAERPEDILNLVDLAEEFNLAMAIEGASGAHLVADHLRRARVSVILPVESPAMMWTDGARRTGSIAAPAKLARAGVPVFVGSATSGANRHLSLAAAQLVGRGVDENTALKSITSDAAKLLGIERETGQLTSGLSADLVIWSGHPFLPDSRVERVFIKGREVYSAVPSERDEPDTRGGEEGSEGSL